MRVKIFASLCFCLLAGIYPSLLLIDAMTSGTFSDRGRVIYAISDPGEFWFDVFCLALAAVGELASAFVFFEIARSLPKRNDT